MARRAKKNYVNNQDFLEALVKYKEECEYARNHSKDLPRVSNYIGECIQQISYRLATKPNFSGYTFKEDMIMDGIENCLTYIENFDAEKSSNPFAYFTQIIYFAFLRRIAKEKKHMYTKFKSSQAMLVLGDTHEGSENLQMSLNVDTSYMDSFMQDYEDKIARDKAKSKAASADVLDDTPEEDI